MIFCCRCWEWKEDEQFELRGPSRPGERITRCNVCEKERRKEVYQKHKQKRLNAAYDKQLKKWNLSAEDFEILSAKQNDVCLICQKTCSSGSRLSIDHDHKTNKIRGLLCKHCNFGLGHFQDDINLLRKAIEYLNEFN